MGKSSIEWTDATWNPSRGCIKISPGCKNCYAETFAERWRGIAGHPYEQGFDPRWVPEKVLEPLRWREPRMVFVNSMSDLFLDEFTEDQIDHVFAVMALAPQHTFQVLTKRAQRMREYLSAEHRAAYVEGRAKRIARERGTPIPVGKMLLWPLPNVWAGVSAETQPYFDERVGELVRAPAAVHFVSIEPQLGPIIPNTEHLAALDWLIIGGESGHGARPFRVEWPRLLIERAKLAARRPAIFVKQLGRVPTGSYYDERLRQWYEANSWEWPDPIGWSECDGQPGLEARIPLELPSGKGNDPAHWPPWLRLREMPEVRRG